MQELFSNSTGDINTANGVNGLLNNVTGIGNSTNGVNSLFSNTTGLANSASGIIALRDNTTGMHGDHENARHVARVALELRRTMLSRSTRGASHFCYETSSKFESLQCGHGDETAMARTLNSPQTPTQLSIGGSTRTTALKLIV
jgi:hypothetical protein